MEDKIFDLRDYEQICTIKEAEEYSAFIGYEWMLFGYGEEPIKVDSESYKHEGFKDNRLLDASTKESLKGRMDCRNCDGSGLFYQMDECICPCRTSVYQEEKQ